MCKFYSLPNISDSGLERWKMKSDDKPEHKSYKEGSDDTTDTASWIVIEKKEGKWGAEQLLFSASVVH